MMQKFICVPKAESDVFVISDGTNDQIESTLSQITDISDQKIPDDCHIIRLADLQSLSPYLIYASLNSRFYSRRVYFMFLNSLNYIHEIISDSLVSSFKLSSRSPIQLKNAFFCFRFNRFNKFQQLDPFDMHYRKHKINEFNTAAMIISQVLNKLRYLLAEVKTVYIDDQELAGERDISLKRLVSNYSNADKFELTSLT